MKKIVWIFLVLILFFPLFSVQGSEPYTIEDYQVDIQVEKSAHLNVEETIQVKDCHQLFIQKDLIQDYTYDANQDGQSELYSYGIDHIEIIGGDVTKTSHDGVVSLKIHLNESNAQIRCGCVNMISRKPIFLFISCLPLPMKRPSGSFVPISHFPTYQEQRLM